MPAKNIHRKAEPEMFRKRRIAPLVKRISRKNARERLNSFFHGQCLASKPESPCKRVQKHLRSPVCASLISRSKPSPNLSPFRSTIASLRSATLMKSPSKVSVSNCFALLNLKCRAEVMSPSLDRSFEQNGLTCGATKYFVATPRKEQTGRFTFGGPSSRSSSVARTLQMARHSCKATEPRLAQKASGTYLQHRAYFTETRKLAVLFCAVLRCWTRRIGRYDNWLNAELIIRRMTAWVEHLYLNSLSAAWRLLPNCALCLRWI